MLFEVDLTPIEQVPEISQRFDYRRQFPGKFLRCTGFLNCWQVR